MAIKNKQIILFVFIITSLALANFLKSKGGKKPLVKISKQESAINISDELISVFDLGQRRLLSDFFWITTLLESDLEHYKNKDKNSWMFLRFKTISTLDPMFLRNYLFGGKYLNIIKTDHLGAEIIFEKGSLYYPDDYELNFNYGFLLAFDLQKYDKAIEKYEKILSRSKSIFLKSLIIKLKHQQNKDLNLIFKLLEETLNTAKNEAIRFKLKTDLYAIKAQIDLSCLNKKLKDCDQLDYDKNPYIFNGKNWNAQKEYNEYKLYKK